MTVRDARSAMGTDVSYSLGLRPWASDSKICTVCDGYRREL